MEIWVPKGGQLLLVERGPLVPFFQGNLWWVGDGFGQISWQPPAGGVRFFGSFVVVFPFGFD